MFGCFNLYNYYGNGYGDFGPYPYAAHIGYEAWQNENFRRAFWTGEQLQMTLMSLMPGEDIGVEMHSETDQIIRVEQGQAIAWMGRDRNRQDNQIHLFEGNALFIPAGTWHNVMNTGTGMLKLSSIYAPVQHERGTLQRTRKEAEYL